ncbi:hypothetical protein CLF_105304 [Clonorchis sinensis]|uniref:Uncharacterized protein n=1 Tax=Clonorchis sinensis TaxID=79923 RepID=G7YDC0_CLOSI|nr:hypothetical protein CLF_105304 [Clonorchis sinensis]
MRRNVPSQKFSPGTARTSFQKKTEQLTHGSKLITFHEGIYNRTTGTQTICDQEGAQLASTGQVVVAIKKLTQNSLSRSFRRQLVHLKTVEKCHLLPSGDAYVAIVAFHRLQHKHSSDLPKFGQDRRHILYHNKTKPCITYSTEVVETSGDGCIRRACSGNLAVSRPPSVPWMARQLDTKKALQLNDYHYEVRFLKCDWKLLIVIGFLTANFLVDLG